MPKTDPQILGEIADLLSGCGDPDLDEKEADLRRIAGRLTSIELGRCPAPRRPHGQVLSSQDRADIMTRFSSEGWTQVRLAKNYGVSTMTIHRLVRGKTYR